MKLIQPEHWQPKGIDDLEPNAWQALRRRDSTSVIAGPGAGKTEFLAQKAAYLLETGLCPPNQKILAISFKTDAAKNLADRVKERCPEELSNRFVSMTFDAFTKSLVDRFHMALPEKYRPSKQYKIAFSQDKEVISSFKSNFYNAVGIYNFTQRLLNMNQFIGNVRIGNFGMSWLEEEFLAFWLGQQINCADDTSRISFLALNRLAEYIIRTNDQVRRAIKETYPFVFIDEFQDTTFAQYDFLSSAFGSKKHSITVVGDYKQRIMGWAGARSDVFHQFENDFSAQRYQLLLNHRSSHELVRIQHVIAHAIDHEVGETKAISQNLIFDAAAWVCCSQYIEQEANYLAQWIANDMRNRSLTPRNYTILVRQKPENYEGELSSHLVQHRLSLRNESKKIGETTLQDLLTEEVTILFCSILKLGLGEKNANLWNQFSADIQMLRNANKDDEKALRQVKNEIKAFISELKHMLLQPFTPENKNLIFDRILDFIDLNNLRQTYTRYSNGNLLEINLSALKEFFSTCAQKTGAWSELLNEFEGINHIPLMTIHKSKGLEFDTTIFMGIDDNAWWSHKPGNSEGLSTFFVAFSRAKQRVIFSYCKERGKRTKVSDFYSLLATAGVPEYTV